MILVDKPTILVAGLLGAGCTASAIELAKLTGLTVVNSESIIREIVSEKKVPYALLIEMVRDGEVDLEDLVRSIALDYAREGGIIIEGRTALMLLDHPALLKVFLYADKKVRVERVAKRRGISLEEAEREVEVSDEDRRRLVEKLFKKSITDPSLYDLMVNTTELTYEDVARLLNDLIKWKHSVKSVARK
ncbi:MAG: cytidylate kinase family protein [Thermofilaceae archaeon]